MTFRQISIKLEKQCQITPPERISMVTRTQEGSEEVDADLRADF